LKLKESKQYSNLPIANLPRDVLLGEKARIQWGVFLAGEMQNYLDSTSVLCSPLVPRSPKYSKYFWNEDTDPIKQYPFKEIINFCETNEELDKYATLLPSDWDDPERIAEIRFNITNKSSSSSSVCKKIWNALKFWKLATFLQNKKTWHYGWLANDGKETTFAVE